MTVSAQTPINRSVGNGVTTEFPYNFKVLSAGDMEVSVNGVVKTLTTDYTLTGVGTDSGNVTMVAPPAIGTVVVRRRVMAYVRTVDYQDQGELPADTLDDDQDASVLMIQQLNEGLERSIRVSPDSSGVDLELPAPTPLTYLRWNSLANALENVLLADVSLISLTAYAQTFLNAIDAAAARVVLGATTIGHAVFTAASATVARAAMNAAAAGPNADITSLAGLTTPLSKGQGGTGIPTARTLAQIQRLGTGASATGATLIPYDNSIPQIGEGDLYMSLAFTPIDAASTLEIEVVWFGSFSIINYLTVSLCQDTVSNALAAGQGYCAVTTQPVGIAFKHTVTAGSTSARTYRVRAGGAATGTTTFNGSAGSQVYGGVMASSITIKEYLP